MSQMPDIDRLLEADEKNVREMQKLFAGCQGLSEFLNETSVLYETCCHAFGQTLNHEINNLPRDTSLDSPMGEKIFAKRLRCLLLMRIGVLYGTAVADLLRMRLTAPLGYIRLQCESMALIKLMSDDISIAKQWVAIKTDKQGMTFFNKYQKDVRSILSTYDLLDAYDHASGSALHSRLIGLAFGHRQTRQTDGLRAINYDKILVQEFNPDEPHYFMITVIFRVLCVQGLIFASIPNAIPEINDPILLGIRFPQFIERLNRFRERAHQYFAQYHLDNDK